MKNNLCFVAGHSGGHIIPCAILAKQNLEKDKICKIIFFTTNSESDKKILQNYNDIIAQQINLPLKSLPKNILSFPKFILQFSESFFKSFFKLIKLKPQKIISTGGLVSIPVCLAGKLLRIPIEIYELNVEPGKTVTFLAKFKPKIFICFSKTQNYFSNHPCTLTSYPVRFDPKIKNITQQEALNKIGFSSDKKTILIIGGSQGSEFINNLVKDFVNKNTLPVRPSQPVEAFWRSRELVEGYEQNIPNFNIIHQTGSIRLATLAQDDREINWKNFYKEKNIPAITFDFNNEMENFYLAADLIICRSGAGTLAEILFFNKKCITIPLETKATKHQVLNAQAMQDKHPELFKVIKQEDIKTNELFFI